MYFIQYSPGDIVIKFGDALKFNVSDFIYTLASAYPIFYINKVFTFSEPYYTKPKSINSSNLSFEHDLYAAKCTSVLNSSDSIIITSLYDVGGF